MPHSTPKRNRVRRRLIPTVVTVALLTGASLMLLPMGVFAIPEKATVIPPDGFATALNAPLRVSVAVEGDLVARRSATVVSLCDWSTRVLWLIPEGTWVKKGDIVCELDRSELQEYIQERELRFIRAQADLSEAEQGLEIQKLINESNIAKASLKATLTGLDHNAYTEAEYPRQLHDQEAQLALLEESLTRAEKTLDFTEDMYRLGYRNANDVENRRLEALRAKQQYDVAKERLSILKSFTRERQVLLLAGKAQDAVMHRSRVEKVAETALLSASVRLNSRQRSYEIYRSYLDRLKKSLEACTIRAPQEGEVVYARTGSDPNDKIREGSSAYMLRPLVNIPDRRRMDVSVRVHESLIRHLQVGQPAEVRVSAAKDKVYSGRVSSVSTVPMQGRYPRYDLREYSVTVTIDGESEVVRELAPGLTAKVEIQAAYKSQALTVPIQSVVESRGRYFVFVREGDDIVDREVTVGMSNTKELEIVSGLEAGAQVVLQPRVRCADQLARLEGLMLAGNSSSWGD